MVDREIPIEVIGNIEEVVVTGELILPHVDIHQLAEQLTRQGGKFKFASKQRWRTGESFFAVFCM